MELRLLAQLLGLGIMLPTMLWDEGLLPTVVSPGLTGILLKQTFELGGLGLGSAFLL